MNKTKNLNKKHKKYRNQLFNRINQSFRFNNYSIRLKAKIKDCFANYMI